MQIICIDKKMSRKCVVVYIISWKKLSFFSTRGQYDILVILLIKVPSNVRVIDKYILMQFKLCKQYY